MENVSFRNGKRYFLKTCSNLESRPSKPGHMPERIELERRLKLLQKPYVIFAQQPDIRNLVQE